MAKEKTSVVFESSVLSEIRNEAKKRSLHVSDVVNEACMFYLQAKNAQDIDKVYSPIIERYLEKHFKSFENRLAALMAKNALDSATTLFLLLEQIAISRKTSVEELYQRFRKMAVKHVQRRDELLKLLEDKLKQG